MPWCPVCKNEYVEGMKECADCHVELVDTLDEMQPKAITFGTEDEMTRLNEFLEYNHLHSGTISFDEKDEVYELCVAAEDEKQAKKITAIFKQQEALSKMNSEKMDEIARQEEEIAADTNAGIGTVHGTGAVYENKKDKAENFKSSAYTLIGVGVAGALLLVLCKAGVIPFPLNMMTTCVMGLLFAVFIIMGISSYQSYKKYVVDASEEETLQIEVKKWCVDNLTKEEIDRNLFEEDVAEEMKYFIRMGKMKQMVAKVYSNLEEGFLDSILEALYPDIFEA